MRLAILIFIFLVIMSISKFNEQNEQQQLGPTEVPLRYEVCLSEKPLKGETRLHFYQCNEGVLYTPILDQGHCLWVLEEDTAHIKRCFYPDPITWGEE